MGCDPIPAIPKESPNVFRANGDLVVYHFALDDAALDQSAHPLETGGPHLRFHDEKLASKAKDPVGVLQDQGLLWNVMQRLANDHTVS